jgi:hypothetical protein
MCQISSELAPSLLGANSPGLWQVEDLVHLLFTMGLADPSKPPELNLHILDAISAAPGALNVGLRREGTVDIAYAHWLNRPGDPDVRKLEMGLRRHLTGQGRSRMDRQAAQIEPEIQDKVLVFSEKIRPPAKLRKVHPPKSGYLATVGIENFQLK